MDNATNSESDIIERFANDLLNQLQKSIKDLEQQNGAMERKIEEIEQKKQSLFDSLFKFSCTDGALSYLDALQSAHEHWSKVLKEGFEFVEKKKDANQVGYKEWQAEIDQRLRSQLDIDKCTFMDYHSVEAEIHKLDLEYETINKQIEEQQQMMNAEKQETLEKCSEYLDTIESIELLLKDVRKEQDEIMEALSIERRKQLCLKPNKEEEQLRHEITMLELKIKQMEKLN